MKFYESGNETGPVILLFPGTVIHCFFAAKISEEYLRRYQQYFEDPDIRRHEMQHEELLICYPEQWAEEIKTCCGLGRADS